MGKRKGRSKGMKRSHLKRFSAAAVNAGQKINGNAHYVLNRSHMESNGVPDYGQSWSINSWKNRLRENYDEDGKEIRRNRDDDPIIKNRPQPFHPIPKTLFTYEQVMAEAFVLPKIETNRLKRQVKDNNGEIKKQVWHEIKLEENDHRKLSLCFYAAKAIFIEVYKGKSIALSISYSSTTKAMAFYKANAIAWGLHRPYATG